MVAKAAITSHHSGLLKAVYQFGGLSLECGILVMFYKNDSTARLIFGWLIFVGASLIWLTGHEDCGNANNGEANKGFCHADNVTRKLLTSL